MEADDALCRLQDVAGAMAGREPVPHGQPGSPLLDRDPLHAEAPGTTP